MTGGGGAKMSRLWAALIFIHVAHPLEESAFGRKVGVGWNNAVECSSELSLLSLLKSLKTWPRGVGDGGGKGK